jgi:WD40 repeat protein
VSSVQWSPDGSVLASASADKTIRLWDPVTGATIRVLEGHVGPICSACWSPDGKTLASGSADSTIRLWDAASGKKLRQFSSPKGGVVALAWSPDGSTLAFGTRDGDKAVYLWDATTGKERRRLDGCNHPLHVLAWSPDGKLLASSSGYDYIRVWDAASGKEFRQFVGDWVRSLAWSPDGKILAAGSADAIRLCDIASGKQSRRFAAHGKRSVSLAWSPDCKTLASGTSDDNIVRLWEATTDKEVQQFAGDNDWVGTVAWSPDGTRLASASSDTAVLIWAIGDPPGEPAIHLNSADLTSCWADLAGDDAAKAYRAIRSLTRAAKDSVPFLGERVQAVRAPDPKRVLRLIIDLDSNEFSVRQKATAELGELGELAAPALRPALADSPSLECRRRLEELVDKLDGWSGERLRVLRAITVLENIGNAEAQQLLRALADGTAEARLTQEAKASLGRLTKRRG